MTHACTCGMRFRSTIAEARHRHNYPALCRQPKTVRKHIYAYAWRSGQVEFGSAFPAGSILIAKGFEKYLRRLIEPACRLSYDGKTLLVPGIPEAKDDDEALDALIKFKNWIRVRAEKRRAA